MVAIVTPERESLARGGQLLLPPRVAVRLRAGAELGPVMDELLGTSNIKQGLGAIGYLTGGLIRARPRSSIASAARWGRCCTPICIARSHK